jgi:hypothetical protein
MAKSIQLAQMMTQKLFNLVANNWKRGKTLQD